MKLHRLSAAALVVILSPAASFAQQAVDTTGPASIRYKGVTITPIAFFAAEGIFRQKNESADMGSSFNGVPFNNTTNAQLTEFRGSGRQSRFGIAGQGKLSDLTMSGYWESDFLSAGVTSNSNESNSYTFRVRQFWAQAAAPDNSWALSGGQMWSLATPNKAGVNPRGEWVPLTIDAQYAVGFDWARQFALRLSTKLGTGAWFAVSAEGPQMTFASRNTPAQVLIGTTGGSQLNQTANYSVDVAPDFIAKLAFEPGFGHYEVKALGRMFRDRIVDPTNVLGGTRNSTASGYGVGVGGFWSFGKAADFSISGLAGKGIGRYGTSQLPDVTVNSTGDIQPIKQAHGIASLEMHATPALDVYLYGGVEYADRTADVNAAGKGVGYGSPLVNNSGCEMEFAPTGQYAPGAPGGTTPCNADTRSIYQGNVGFWHRIYKGAAGTMQWGMHYSYTVRSAWSAVGGEPQATENMVFGSFRYYLP